ncbi:NosR/NirI family protein [Parathalassolituus penaei]|uniref:4Fe-4S binding protein n=1 Tax=Parathalassolituus penaei TaxID=2997323 RepID=A0A9X3EAN6_9GAMM|nr:NosR/NirI family protein [Parathalassolituus penaei]MCY0963690.1 4Fe-4S binding protein [Parathalassolituus penaei]
MGKPANLLLLLLAFWCCVATTQAEVGSVQQAWIQELFPKATRIEDKQTDFPVYPVYQLNQLLGYAYESRDISDLPGFSGKPINLMIGIDLEGRFTGVRVMDHHEPVFLHGLGPEPMINFINQYNGRSLTEHIVIDSSRTGEPSTNGVVYVDGVSKATVSVIIMNDTILSSALQVARHKLEGFAQAPAARAIEDLYEPLDWQQLLDKGYVGHVRISQQDAVRVLGTSLDSYPDLPEAEGDEAFSEIWYAYINAPSIGRNLLGDSDFERLMNSIKPGEQVMAIMSGGIFPHVPDDFRPGTVPGRLSLEQGGLIVELRDMDLLNGNYHLQAQGIPEFQHANMFRVGGQAGFNPGAEANLKISAELPRNHLITDNATFEVPLTFPANLFEVVEAESPLAAQQNREPIWVGLWKSRWHSIVIISLALVVLTVFFARQKHYTQYPKLVHRFRWGFLWFTLVYLGFYAQGQLSVVNIYTLFLQIHDGFDIGVFLLDPVIFILWIYTFISLFIWGRGLFCGWLCPFGALQEMAAWLATRLKIKQIRVPEPLHRKLILIKYPILLGLVGSAFYSLTLAEQLAEVEPFKTSITLYFWRYWPFVLYAVALLVGGMFIHKFYCRYLCPLGAGLAVLGRLRLFSWLERIEKCGSPCQLCKRRCGINAIRTEGSIDYDECIQCLECVVILRDEQQCVDKINNRKQKQRAQLLATDATATDVGFTQSPRKV